MVRHEAQLLRNRPEVIKQVTGEEIDAEQLGGVESHASYSGVVHFVAETRSGRIAIVHRLLSFLPSRQHGGSALRSESAEEEVEADGALEAIVPEDHREPTTWRA